MSAERIDFLDNDMCNPMLMTEHYSRYAITRSIVKNKRVLDIACGEGYGSRLMKDFGAQSVTGVDISESAIEKAKRLFSKGGVEYFQADATRVGCVVEGKYDLIVSFETIEHLKNPELFLAEIKKLLNEDGIIIISCPNDHIAMGESECNPYHEKKYSLKEFQELTEAILGTANQWLFGVNVQGYAVVSHDDALINDDWISPSDILKSRLINESHLIPSQSNTKPKSTNVLFYIGVWGKCDSITSSALSAQSYAAFVEPWKALDWFKNEVARLQGIIKTQECNKFRLIRWLRK